MPFRVRATAGHVIRRLGLLPGGMPDGIGEDESLTGVALESKIVVFFPDPPENLYQLRQWYRPFEELNRAFGVTVIVQDSRTAAAARAETDLPIIVAARTRTVGLLLSEGAVRAVLYVGQANANAAALRSPEVLHAFLNHGDSDKLVSVSNQVKGFDRVFVAGQAGVDRHASALMYFNSDIRLRIVGRPQLPQQGSPEGPLTVLYAPTWEGTMPVNGYSSIRDYGDQLVRGLLADPEIHVIYRPHPRTGVSDSRFKDADKQIRALVARHPDRATVDTSPDPTRSFQSAHAMIADISAIATDWLGQRRALVSTVSPDPVARVAAPARLFAETPHVTAATAGEAARIVRVAIANPDNVATLTSLADYYLANLGRDESLATFIAACGEMIDDCDAERERLRRL